MRPGPAALLLLLMVLACAMWQFVLCFFRDLDTVGYFHAASPLHDMPMLAIVAGTLMAGTISRDPVRR